MTPAISTPFYKRRRYKTTHASNVKASSKLETDNFSIKESETGFHYELKIPGYIKDDFNFYISGNHLVLTTDKSKCMMPDVVKSLKHSYCYPSAYFKKIIPLPNKLIKKEISVAYKDEVLSFDLFKI